MIENQPNEMTIIYNSEKADDKKARAFAESLPGYVIKTLDLMRDRLTETQLAELAAKAGSAPEDLMDATFNDTTTPTDDLQTLDPNGMLTLMVKDPKLIRTPILVIGSRAFVVDSSYDLVKEEMGIRGGNLASANREEKN